MASARQLPQLARDKRSTSVRATLRRPSATHATFKHHTDADGLCYQMYRAHLTQTLTSTRSLQPLLCPTSCVARTNS